jgi:hypothetical protein
LVTFITQTNSAFCVDKEKFVIASIAPDGGLLTLRKESNGIDINIPHNQVSYFSDDRKTQVVYRGAYQDGPTMRAVIEIFRF